MDRVLAAQFSVSFENLTHDTRPFWVSKRVQLKLDTNLPVPFEAGRDVSSTWHPAVRLNFFQALEADIKSPSLWGWNEKCPSRKIGTAKIAAFFEHHKVELTSMPNRNSLSPGLTRKVPKALRCWPKIILLPSSSNNKLSKTEIKCQKMTKESAQLHQLAWTSDLPKITCFNRFNDLHTSPAGTLPVGTNAAGHRSPRPTWPLAARAPGATCSSTRWHWIFVMGTSRMFWHNS